MNMNEQIYIYIYIYMCVCMCICRYLSPKTMYESSNYRDIRWMGAKKAPASLGKVLTGVGLEEALTSKGRI